MNCVGGALRSPFHPNDEIWGQEAEQEKDYFFLC
jgi:hypothetical protein